MVRALVLELFESFGSEYVREQLFKNIKHVIKLVNDALKSVLLSISLYLKHVNGGFLRRHSIE